MELNLLCPVCGDTRITPILRKTLLSTSDPLENATVVAYRCQNGHIHIKASRTDENTLVKPAA